MNLFKMFYSKFGILVKNFSTTVCPTVRSVPLSVEQSTDFFLGWTRLFSFLDKHNYKPAFLMDEFADRLCKCSPNSIDYSTLNSYVVLQYLSDTYYRPKNVDWNLFRDILVHPNKISKCSTSSLIKMMHYLAVVKDYSKLNCLLDSERDVYKVVLNDHKNAARFLLTYAGSAIEDSNNNHEFIMKTKSWISDLIEMFNVTAKRRAHYNFDNALLTGLGGPSFFDSFYWTQNGILLNYIIVMRKGNYPVSIRDENQSNSIRFIENLNLPKEAKIVTLLPLLTGKFLKEPYGPRGILKHRIRLIKKLQIVPVLINLDYWCSLSDRDQVPFLMKEINGACSEDGEIFDPTPSIRHLS